MNTLKILLIIIFGIGTIGMFLTIPKQACFFYILIKPLIDRFGENGAMVAGTYFGYHYIVGIFFPLMTLLYTISLRMPIGSLPFLGIITSYFFINILSFFIEGNYSLTILSYYLRVILPLFLYISIPFILQNREDVLKFIKFVAFSGITPVTTILLQKLGFIEYNRALEGLGTGTYLRATGGYHDSFTVALPIVISILAILFLLQYLKDSGKPHKIYWVMLPVFVFSLFFTYHRMTFACVSVIIGIWIIINKRKGLAIFLLLLIVTLFPILVGFVSSFYADIYMVTPSTSNEVTLDNSEESVIDRQTMNGRWGLWEHYWTKYTNAPLLRKLFGVDMTIGGTHNDYLRILLTNGLFGLSVYLVMLTLIGIKIGYLLRSSFNQHDYFIKQFLLMTLLMFIFYVVSSMTLTISLLSTSSWFFWIFTGIAFYQYQIAQHEVEEEVLK